MSQTITATRTYTVVDIENVVRRLRADLVMIASSSRAVTENKAHEYADDIEVLAKGGYLKHVDVTLFSNGIEKRATRFHVNTDASDLTGSRPGGVRWPEVSQPFLRVVLVYTPTYTQAAREATQPELHIAWTPTSADTSHASLAASGGRDYASNGYGMQRKDWTG